MTSFKHCYLDPSDSAIFNTSMYSNEDCKNMSGSWSLKLVVDKTRVSVRQDPP